MNKFEMIEDYVYGVFKVPPVIFNSLEFKYHISGSDENTIYMCANSEETKYLKSLGFLINNPVDYFKIIKINPTF